MTGKDEPPPTPTSLAAIRVSDPYNYRKPHGGGLESFTTTTKTTENTIQKPESPLGAAEDRTDVEDEKSLCSSLCERDADFGVELLNGNDLVAKIQNERSKFYEKLQQDYGPENFRNIFLFKNDNGEEISQGRRVLVSPAAVSWQRFKRKLMMKILAAQMTIKEDRNVRADCNCERRALRRLDDVGDK